MSNKLCRKCNVKFAAYISALVWIHTKLITITQVNLIACKQLLLDIYINTSYFILHVSRRNSQNDEV